VSVLCKNLILLLVLLPFCSGGVANNPFLRPGSNRPPPPVNTPPPPPKPVPNPAFAKEVEFRGYFLLKGIPYFSIFNKKANMGEWIKLNEQTYEEFKAQAFDLESETLTLAFSGQDFTLTLEQSKSIPQKATPISALPKVKLPPGVSSSSPSSSGTRKTMPPKPRVAPKLPDWLANRMASRSGSSYSPTPSSRSSATVGSSGMSFPPSRVAPTYSTGSTSGSSSFSPSTGSPTTGSTFAPAPSNTFGGTPSSPSASFPSNSVPSNPTTPDQVNESEPVTETDDQSELEDLPPPPPPPNILPPSPPPDILPSLDE